MHHAARMREQPLERARRDEGVVRRPAVAPDEDADVAHEVDLEEDNRPARRRSGRHAEEREQPEQQQRRHDVVVVVRDFPRGRRFALLHLVTGPNAHRLAADADAAAEPRGVAHQMGPLAVRSGECWMRERRVPRRRHARSPHAVRVTELLAVGQTVAVAVLAAKPLVPVEAGGGKVLSKGVPRKAHVGDLHPDERVHRLRQR